MSGRKVLMSGMRPTGRLHLGNYWGALKNWVDLQEAYQCYFAVASWHMLTTGYDDTSSLLENEREMVLDWLGAGLDPGKAVIFRQSDVTEHAELALLLGMITPLSWLENNPTWKEQLQELAKSKREKMLASGPTQEAQPREAEAREELRTHGFLGYPVLQAADILMYGAEVVPVGQDQLPHLELSREIARKFNGLYGEGTLTVPQPLLTETPKLPGIDGRKMSKSYGNAIDMLETTESLSKKVMAAYTDPTRLRATDPGHPEPCPENPPGCSVYALHKLYNTDWPRRGDECRAGHIGCVACKKLLLPPLEAGFAKFRERRASYASQPGRVEQVLDEGRKKAKAAAERTLEKVRRAMRLR
ncbi:MAG: tryptophan--tRNA ligase [Elusimicrobia bacterium]|nr:tryptophan--tRNA ligase [Elusimicrobiota bacterium]